jgi:hypothetical protein
MARIPRLIAGRSSDEANTSVRLLSATATAVARPLVGGYTTCDLALTNTLNLLSEQLEVPRWACG